MRTLLFANDTTNITPGEVIHAPKQVNRQVGSTSLSAEGYAINSFIVLVLKAQWRAKGMSDMWTDT